LSVLNADYPSDEGTYRCKLTDNTSTKNSSSATLTVNYLPVITVHPVSNIYNDGNGVSYSVTATEGKPAGLTYKWQRSTNGGGSWSDLSAGDETSISGITSDTLTFECQLDRADYRYRCVVSNSAGSVNSNAAILYINPKITTNLSSTKTVTVESGQQNVLAVFTVVAGGSAALSYQWYKNNSQIGANNASFADTVNETHTGAQYYCVVSSNVSGTSSASLEMALQIQQ
jgi:hypothetical protein